jgi:hypothetical protein
LNLKIYHVGVGLVQLLLVPVAVIYHLLVALVVERVETGEIGNHPLVVEMMVVNLVVVVAVVEGWMIF